MSPYHQWGLHLTAISTEESHYAIQVHDNRGTSYIEHRYAAAWGLTRMYIRGRIIYKS